MEKAYDRLDWSFIMSMLRQFGFGNLFVDLVFWTLSNNWFSMANLRVFKIFSWSLARGSTLSPPLFILAVEFLVWGVHKLFNDGERMFYQSKGLPVPVLSFADDTILFTRISRPVLVKLKAFLDLYQSVSRQKINMFLRAPLFAPTKHLRHKLIWSLSYWDLSVISCL